MGNSIPDGSGAPWCMLPQHRRSAIKHNQPGRIPGQCFALKCGHFSIGVFGLCFQTIQYCQNPSNRQVGTWRYRWIPISIQISTCKTLHFSLWLWVYFWRKSSTTESASFRSCNPGELVQSQQRVKSIGFGYNRNPPQLLCGLRLMFNVSFKTLIEL